MIQEAPILGFQPDMPQDTTGVIVDSDQVLPTDRGIGNGWGLTAQSAVFNGAAVGGFVAQNIDGTRRPFIGTPTKLWELVAGVATDRSGGVYAANAAQQWAFGQWGDVVLAVNKNNKVQTSAAGASFTEVATAPKANVMATPGLPGRTFAMLFDCDDGVDNLGDLIYWSPIPTTSWTPDVPSQIGKTRLTDVNGAFTAAVPYRDGVLAFKLSAMYLGSYVVGGTDMWDWVRISNNVGCSGPNAVCVANDIVYFADPFGLWMFDGSYPRQMPGSLHQWFARTAHVAPTPDIRLMWDKTQHVLWVRYSDDGFGNALYLAFNPRSGLWTKYGSIVDTTGTLAVSHLISANYGATFGAGQTQFVALLRAGSASSAGRMRFAAFGNDYAMVTARSIRPHWLAGPSDAMTGWVSGNFYHGPTLRNLSAPVLPLSFHQGGGLDGQQQDFWIQPEITVAAGLSWELNKAAADVTKGGAT